jgi:hypothetical protein
MPLPDDIAANLPPPRDDEPASLRRDIVDELADHLACALERERQRDAAVPAVAETPAWQRVLTRFGNPSALALQLWREAIQENLLMQRILSAMGIATLGVICVGMFLIVRSVNRQQDAMLVQQREMAEILQQLSARVDRPAPQAPPHSSIEWVPVEISLSAVDPAKKLPAGFNVRLVIHQSDSTIPPYSAKTDESSRIRFPLVHYGRYTLAIDAPWGEYVAIATNVAPGTPLTMNVLCPDAPPEPVTVKPELVLPEDLRERSLHVSLLVGSGQRNIGDLTWDTYSQVDGSSGHGLNVLLGADGRLRPLHESDGARLKHFTMYDKAGNLAGLRWPGASLMPGRSVRFHLDGVAKGEQVQGHFQMEAPFVLGPEVRLEVTEDRRLRFEPTEEGLAKLRRLLARFDETGVDTSINAEGFSRYGSGVPLPPIPEHRP